MTVGWAMVAAIDTLDDRAEEYPWIKLHVGDPGAAGTANPAVETDRIQATWGAAAASVDNLSAQLTHTNDLEWTTVAGTEDYTHVSGWSASTAGTFGWSGLLTADAVVTGNNFTLPAGAYILRQPVAAT
jgi:hypothetical protein